MIKSHLNLAQTYKTRYHHPATGEVLNQSQFVRDGKKITGRVYYLVGKDWLLRDDVPEYREHIKNKLSCLEGFFTIIKKTIAGRDKNLLGKSRYLIGENEFKDKRDCYDKLRAHYYKQEAEYGPFCPITGIEFTFERPNEKKGRNHSPDKISTNMSPDRLLNPLHYTTQNTLFTSIAWNLLRGNFSLKDMSIYMPKDYYKNYARILVERFPDKKYEVDQLTKLENGAEHPQWGR